MGRKNIHVSHRKSELEVEDILTCFKHSDGKIRIRRPSPDDSEFNYQMFLHNAALSEFYGGKSDYYVNDHEYTAINNILIQYDFPEIIKENILFCWLNMLYGTKIKNIEEYDENYKSYINAFETIKSIANDGASICSFSITTKSGGENKSENQSFTDEHSLSFLKKGFFILINSHFGKPYSIRAESYKLLLNKNLKSGKRLNFQSQDKKEYTKGLYNYLNSTKVNIHHKKRKKGERIHSKNNTYILIGKIMAAAGLIPPKEDEAFYIEFIKNLLS